MKSLKEISVKIDNSSKTNQIRLDLLAIESEKKRLKQQLQKNREAPKYDLRSQSYEPWFNRQGRLIRQVEACDTALRVYGRM